LSDQGFDIAASAGWYSAIAGGLAGFALLAILLPLDHASDEVDESRTADAVVVFTCAFFALLILAFTYAVLAGRTGEGPETAVAAYEQLLNGAAFGLATLLLLFGLFSILRAYGSNRVVFQPAQRAILAMIAILGPTVLLALQFSSSLDLERYRLSGEQAFGDCGPWGLPVGVWINLGIVLTAIAAVVVLAFFRARLPTSRSASTLLAKAVLGLTGLIAVWTSLVVPLLPVSAVGGAALEHGALAVVAAASVTVSVAAWASRA
jgi:hypothetical protein